MALKIKAAAEPPETMKVSYNLPMSTVQMLKAYGKAYKAEYGKEPDEDYLVNEVIMGYLESDRDFKNFLADNPDIAEVVQGEVKKRGRKPTKAGPVKTVEVAPPKVAAEE